MFRLNKYQTYLLLILGVAFALRIWGVDFGLPHIYHTDEWNEVKRALKLGAGVFDFDRAGKGGYFYLLFVEYGIYFVVLKIFGLVKSGNDFLFRFFQDPTAIWMIGRVTTAVIGTINCYLIYLLGENAFSRSTGLFAAIFMAIHWIHVISSHYITVDVPLTTLITVCFLIMNFYRIESGYRVKHYALLGVFAALALITKITAGPILLSILVFHLLNLKTEPVRAGFRSYIMERRFLCFVIIFPIVYMVGEPGILFQYKKIAKLGLSFFDFSSRVNGGGEVLAWPIIASVKPPILFYLGELFPLKYLLFSVSFVLGLALALKKDWKRNLILLVFFIPYVFFICASTRPTHVFSRYLLPILPIVYLYSGFSLEMSLVWLTNKFRYGKLIFSLIFIIGIFPLVADSIAIDMDLSKPDTRTIAKEWIERNVPATSEIYIEGSLSDTSFMTVPLNINPDLIDSELNYLLPSGEMNSDKSDFYSIKKKWLKTVKTYNLIWINRRYSELLSDAIKKGIGDYAIVRYKRKKLFSFEVNKKSFPEEYKLYSWVGSKDFRLEKVFEPDGKFRGPTILIYKRVK